MNVGCRPLCAIALLLAVWGLARADNTRIVATVGTQMISEGDLLRKQEMQRCYGDSTATIEQCCMMLATDALDRDVLRAAYSLEPPISALTEKAAWIDTNTRDPLKLRCVKETFGRDTAQYLRLFVSPTLVNPKLHALYALDRTKHASERDSIEKLWAIVKANPSAITALPHDTVSIPRAPQPSPIAGAPTQGGMPIVDSVLSHLAPGAMWHSIVEDDNGYMIIRLDSISATAYHTTTIRVAKRPFDDWYREFVRANVPIHFIDGDLVREVKKNYPQLWWLQP